MNHIHIPVGGHEVEGAWMGNRIDRKLSSFGVRFYEKYLESKYHNTVLNEKIKELFEIAKEDLEELFKAESKLDESGLFGEDRDSIYKEIDDIRRKLTKQSNFVTLSIRDR